MCAANNYDHDYAQASTTDGGSDGVTGGGGVPHGSGAVPAEACPVEHAVMHLAADLEVPHAALLQAGGARFTSLQASGALCGRACLPPFVPLETSEGLGGRTCRFSFF